MTDMVKQLNRCVKEKIVDIEKWGMDSPFGHGPTWAILEDDPRVGRHNRCDLARVKRGPSMSEWVKNADSCDLLTIAPRADGQ
jgi:hypothetical protein